MIYLYEKQRKLSCWLVILSYINSYFFGCYLIDAMNNLVSEQ